MTSKLLNDLRVQAAKPKDKPYRLADGDNLYLLVLPSGVKSWQLRYRHDGKPQTATLGKLDLVGLAKAWLKREARRKAWSPDYVQEATRSIELHLSSLNGLPVREITAAITSPVLRRIEAKAPAMEAKVHRRLHAIMDYAVEVGALRQNPLPRRRSQKSVSRHFPAVVDLPGIGAILRRAAAADPSKGIKRAHVMLAFTAQRVSEVVGARWDELDLETATWTIPRMRMKKKDAARGPHVVPLPPQLAALLKQWRGEDDGASNFVCPAPRDPAKSITTEACEKHYRDVLGLAGKHSPHSWRSSFSTLCRAAGQNRDVIEAQLDHQVGNKTESAYDRATRLDLRCELMTWYESTLVAARDGAQVVPLPSRRRRD